MQEQADQADAVVTNALSTALHTHDFVPTRFGSVVAAVADRFKIGLHGALLVAAGVGCGCALDASRLALLLESVNGELRNLWNVSPPQPPPGCATSDHAALSAILNEVVDAAPGQAGFSGSLAKRGLAPGPWLAARDAVRSAERHMEAIDLPDAGIAKAILATCPPAFRRGRGLNAAVLAARGFNAARFDGSGRRATTVHSLRPVTADVRPMLPGTSYGSGGGMCVFEHLTLVSGGAKLSCVTR